MFDASVHFINYTVYLSSFFRTKPVFGHYLLPLLFFNLFIGIFNEILIFLKKLIDGILRIFFSIIYLGLEASDDVV